jgi:cytochrome c oxidase subunit 4
MTHASPRKTYYLIFAALIVLTITTVAAATVDLGPFHAAAALGIAFLKATLVVLFFMHVKESSSLTKVYVSAGLVWLAIMIALTFGDYQSRDWLSVPQGWTDEQGPANILK